LANKAKAERIRRILLGWGGAGGIAAYLLRRKIAHTIEDTDYTE